MLQVQTVQLQDLQALCIDAAFLWLGFGTLGIGYTLVHLGFQATRV